MRPFIQHQPLNLYATPPHQCGYLPEQQATTIFLDPHIQKDNRIYSQLTEQGFRRSGEHLYRPHCTHCQACVSVRIPVHAFEPRRSQTRVWQKNQDITVRPVAPVYKPEHFSLYRRYITHRHKGGGMDTHTPDGYMQFLTSHWANSVFYEFHQNDRLLAVSVVDHLSQGWSAVYTFFDPSYPQRSLGTYVILWQIAAIRKQHLNWLYLGYWIADCRKMRYKTDYHPLEYYLDGQWSRD